MVLIINVVMVRCCVASQSSVSVLSCWMFTVITEPNVVITGSCVLYKWNKELCVVLLVELLCRLYMIMEARLREYCNRKISFHAIWINYFIVYVAVVLCAYVWTFIYSLDSCNSASILWLDLAITLYDFSIFFLQICFSKLRSFGAAC